MDENRRGVAGDRWMTRGDADVLRHLMSGLPEADRQHLSRMLCDTGSRPVGREVPASGVDDVDVRP